MSSRIIYAANGAGGTAVRDCEELGRVDGGAWLACGDEALRAMAERQSPAFLYFHRREYETAVEGLAPAEIRDVVRRRRDQWAPQAKGYVLSALFDEERAALEGALQAGNAERPLKLLQRMAGLERYRSTPAKAMAVTMAQGEALLLAVLKSALQAGSTPEDRRLLVVHRDRRQSWSGEVTRAAAALGAKELENTVPFADPTRAVFAHPAGRDLERALSGEASARWRDGLVFVTAERRFEELRRQKRSIEVLYADPGEFYDSLEALTQPQLHRDFAARLGRPAVAARLDALGYIDRLHLHQILMKREFCGRADAARVCAQAGFNGMIREEAVLLGRSLAYTRTFSRSQRMDGLAPAALLEAADHAVAADLWLFGEVAHRYWPNIAPDLQELEKLRQSG